VTLRILQATAVALAAAWAAAATGASPQTTRLHPPDVKFVASPQNVVDAMLELAHVTAADVVYDLGSGDGRIPITAAERYGARGVGIEIDPALACGSSTRTSSTQI
jgi:cyclopropane fatty-acyl-phospholipid synthase-like methyltransferase